MQKSMVSTNNFSLSKIICHRNDGNEFVFTHRKDYLYYLARSSLSQLCDNEKVQVGKDQEMAQSAKDSHSKNPRWEKTKLTIRYLYHENIS